MPENLLFLTSPTTKQLYEKYAKNAPIYDFHCHLSAREIYEDAVFSDISDIWLAHDHYKWRALRFAGVDERLITGSATGLEKFRAWARICSRLVGSPLNQWTRMELALYFDIGEILDETNADRIYAACNERIRTIGMRPSHLIRQSDVRLICTTDDPADQLDWHRKIAARQDPDLQVLPAFRPDRSLKIQQPDFIAYLAQLAASAGRAPISNYADLLAVLAQRVTYFAGVGCRLSDHSLELPLRQAATPDEAAATFARRLAGQIPDDDELCAYQMRTLIELAALYRRHGWAMQLHIGALRNANRQRFAQLGPDSGYDIMNDFAIAAPLAALLNQMDAQNGLPPTILYTLNSKDNLFLAALPHCFADGRMPGPVQFGAPWWFNDSKDGILEHFRTLAAQNMLPWFVGMLTDSRSFLSYARHDYFRRLLCKFVGEQVDAGEFAARPEVLGEIITGVCGRNIVRFLNLEA